MTTCYCPICSQPITDDMFDGIQLMDHYVYKCGELSYIELAHTACGEEANRTSGSDYWKGS